MAHTGTDIGAIKDGLRDAFLLRSTAVTCGAAYRYCITLTTKPAKDGFYLYWSDAVEPDLPITERRLGFVVDRDASAIVPMVLDELQRMRAKYKRLRRVA